MNPEISVIITTYNQSVEVIRHSIMSVLFQEEVDYELIIADDHSKANYFEDYRQLFKQYNFSHYKLIRNSENLKTVLNIAHALEYAEAPYVKLIDAGDMLYSPHTLRQILDFCKLNMVSVGFGKINRFKKGNRGKYFKNEYLAPRCVDLFCPSATKDYNPLRILRHQMERADWIPASSQFYETSVYLNLLRQLSSDFNVKYCQDFTSILALKDYEIHYFPKPIYWYEWGSGISTNGSFDSRMRLYADHNSFYSKMRSSCYMGSKLNTAYLLFLARYQIAKMPIYPLFAKLLNNKAFAEEIEDKFFLSCMEDADKVK